MPLQRAQPSATCTLDQQHRGNVQIACALPALRLMQSANDPPLQVKSLADMGWFLSLGTAAQLFALVVVVIKLFMAPLATASTELVHSGAAAVSIVAVMNMIFACAPRTPSCLPSLALRLHVHICPPTCAAGLVQVYWTHACAH
jgi:hypothetical protein